MLRLALLLVLLAMPVRAARVPEAAPLQPSTAFSPVGPAGAKGALVWLHGSYDSDAGPAPAEPGWVARLAARGFDIWRFDRTPGADPLPEGGALLAQGLAGLRHGGYRHVVVAGHSRGAFIALSALARPDLADAVVAISPAAHGTAVARRPAAMAAFTALMQGAGRVDLVLALMADDPLEPDAEGRAALARAMAARTGSRLLLIDRPAAPVGHMGGYEPEFDALFGDRLVTFLAPAAP